MTPTDQIRALVTAHEAEITAATRYLDTVLAEAALPCVLFLVHDSHAEFADLLVECDVGEPYPRMLGQDALLMPAYVPDAVKLLVECGYGEVAADLASEYDAIPEHHYIVVALVETACLRWVFRRRTAARAN